VLTTPILEGLDGAQKMSKSLGNAIGIHEPPREVYGKIMSISDQMMWRYYELLTDVQVAEIEKMKREAHPMQSKKDLARRIVADFHSPDAASKAGEDWARQFQKDEVPEEAEECRVSLASVEYRPGEELGNAIPGCGGNPHIFIDLPRLLVSCGLADSKTDAARKLKQNAVKIHNVVETKPRLAFESPLPNHGLRLTLRVGKKLRIAVIQT
jgi:tyrosyl-tRNA synthetase